MTESFSVPSRAPDYADVFSGHLAHGHLSARELMEYALSKTPRWFQGAFWVRNRVAKLFGLKTEAREPVTGPAVNMLTKMPVILETDSLFSSGLSDKHLDFLITVEKADGSRVSMTTQIWFNATLGKLYLIAVLPFHKAILRYYIRKLGQSA